MLEMIKQDIKEAIDNWRILHLKTLYESSMDELIKKLDFDKRLMWSFTITTLVILTVVVELFIRNKVSIVFNTLLILSVIALYDTTRNYNILQLFIYLKKKEQEEG